ncbi:hypothetical protein [Agromyces sp. PvR057]|uniref:hypothetical protein n=1 Tax=Agromyces sp. PvR057 TaxID=3156403 RepID=UPI0033935BA0
MTTPRATRSSPLRMLLAALLGLGIAGAAVPAPAAAADSPPPLVFVLHFQDLQPGEPQTQSDTFTLPRSADLIALEWLERSGIFTVLDLDTEVCDASGTCVDPDAGGGVLVAGELTVTVTATMTGAGAGATPTGSAVGRLTFTGQDPAPDAASGAGALGGTGVDGWVPTAWAAALLALGALALRAGRRGRLAPGDEGREGH